MLKISLTTKRFMHTPLIRFPGNKTHATQTTTSQHQQSSNNSQTQQTPQNSPSSGKGNKFFYNSAKELPERFKRRTILTPDVIALIDSGGASAFWGATPDGAKSKGDKAADKSKKEKK